jgi:methylphosphotriester-DNA--protein-cysteine methyltransferase
MYKLLGPDGPYESQTPGVLGGHSRQRVYGRLDCPVARSLIARGKNKPQFRVFFASESDAIASGYRPCGACMRREYAAWKAAR